MVTVSSVESCQIYDLCITQGLAGKACLMSDTFIVHLSFVQGPKQTACLSNPSLHFTVSQKYVNSFHFFCCIFY